LQAFLIEMFQSCKISNDKHVMPCLRNSRPFCCTLQEKASSELLHAKKQMDNFRTEYEMLQVDDRAMDKGFRREFSELSNVMADVLLKHFRKRPK